MAGPANSIPQDVCFLHLRWTSQGKVRCLEKQASRWWGVVLPSQLSRVDVETGGFGAQQHVTQLGKGGKTTMNRNYYQVVVIVTLAFLSGAAVFGQTTAQLTGLVTDSTGAVIPEAQVTVSNQQTGIEREVRSGAAGSYTVPFLPPGVYRVRVDKEGFRAVVRSGVRLEVNQVGRVDFSMEVGAVTETVEVTGAPPLIESDTSSIGQVIEEKAVVDLPLNGRNFVQLAILGPGVTGVGFGAAGTIMAGNRPDDLRPGSEIFSNGNREGSNNFMLDGVDNNDRITLSISLRPSVESVREFKIQTNMFAADQGRNSGVTVNVITKSGSNQFHGSTYEFLRNNKADARAFFDNPNDEEPAFRQNQFGGTIGGPIKRDKLFFFGSYEGFRQRLATTSVNTLPTLAMREGDFSEVRDIYNPFSVRPDAGAPSKFTRDAFVNRQIPMALWDPVGVKLLNAIPAPDKPGLVNNQTTAPKNKQRWNQGDVRVDWNASDSDIIYGRFSRQDTITTKPSTFDAVEIPGIDRPVALGSERTFAGDSTHISHNVVLNWVKTFSPTLLFEGKAGYSRFDLQYLQEGAEAGAKLGEQLGVPNSNQGPFSDGIPIVFPSGYQEIGQTRSLPIIRIQNTFNYTGAFTHVAATHTRKFGFEARRRQATEIQNNRGSGRFNFNPTFTNNPNATANTGDSIAGVLLGVPSTIEQDFSLVTPGIRGSEFGFYVQDDWKVSDKLTLNLGLRYDLFTRFSEVADRWTNFDIISGKLLIAGFNADSNVAVEPDLNNLAPRFGFAYRLSSNTVIRGGYGIFYNTSGTGGLLLRRHRQLPFGPINVEDINFFDPNPRRMSDGFRPIPNLDFAVVADNPSGSVLAVARDFKNAYAQQYNFGIQHHLNSINTVLKAHYVGTLSRGLDSTFNPNQPVPGPGGSGPRRPFRNLAPGVVNINYNVSDGIANYQALQLSAEKRFSGSLGFLASYTWGHSIDNVPNAFGGADNGPNPQDIRNRHSAERGTSGFDIAHRFTYSTNYVLPVGKGRGLDFNNAIANNVIGGWEMNAIVTLQTGLPHTPTLQSSVSNAGGSRPDRLKSGKIDNPTIDHWFDTSFNESGAAWGVPEIFTFGNAGRNILRGPGRVNFDYSLFKNIPVGEAARLQFRAEFFNLFNTPQFGLPADAIGSPSAGVIGSTVGNPRQVQFGLRLSF